MNIVRGVAELNQGLQQLLENRDCSLVSARHLATEMVALRVEREVYDPNTDTTVVEPHFYYIVVDGTAIFLFADDPFLIYVFDCTTHDLITHIESLFSNDAVERCKNYLASLHGKGADLAASATIGYEWMGGS